MLLILFQPAQNSAFSQANASGLFSVRFFLFPNSQLIPSCRKHCVFTGKCNLCASRTMFSYSLILNLIPNCKKQCVFTGKRCMCLSSHFFLFPNSQLIPSSTKHCVTFGNTRAETLRFGGAGVQHSACCRVWIFCPSTVSLSDVFTSFGLQTLLWKHHSACCWSFSNLRKTVPFHKQMHPVCFPCDFFYSLIRNLFQAAENIVFSQVNATFVLLVPFFPFPVPISQPYSKLQKSLRFHRWTLHVSLVPFFSYSLIHHLFQTAKIIAFSRVNAACLSRPIFS